MEAAPACFGLQRNHHQGATASAYLKLQDWFIVNIDVMQTSVLWRHSMTCTHAPHRSYYAAIALASTRRLY